MLIGLDRSENHDGRSNKKLLFKKEIIFVTFRLSYMLSLQGDFTKFTKLEIKAV